MGKPIRVLFVCSGNAHRSPLAEALLKKMRPDLQVDSAGIHTVIPIADEVKDYLVKENAEQHLKKEPERLQNKRLDDYDLIVAMEQKHKDYVLSLCMKCTDKIVLWNIKDPYFMDKGDALEIYEQIRQKVTELTRKPLT